MALLKVPFDASSDENVGMPIVVRPHQTATGIDVDCLRGKVYWTDTTGRAIRRADYDGSNHELFFKGGPGFFPEGVAIDWVARSAFWTDSGRRTVEAASLDNSKYVEQLSSFIYICIEIMQLPPPRLRVTLVEEGISNPRGIAAFPSAGYRREEQHILNVHELILLCRRLFWSDWDRNRPRIESSYFDGSDRRVVVDAMIGMPNSLTADHDRGLVCWADGGAPMTMTRGAVSPKIGMEANYPTALTLQNSRSCVPWQSV